MQKKNNRKSGFTLVEIMIVVAGADLQPYLGRGSAGELPSCPVDPANTFATSYSVLNVGSKPTCLIVSSTHILP